MAIFIKKNKKIYSGNDGILAFVGGEGHLFVTLATSERNRAFEMARYRSGGFWVFFIIADPEVRRQREEMREEARKYRLLVIKYDGAKT